MKQVFLCAHCHRIVTPVRRLFAEIGNLLVAPIHSNEEGERCDGDKAEVIEGWDKP